MALESVVTETYALHNGDCVEVMQELPDAAIDMSIYSPPFCGLYNYSSDARDLSNCRGYDEFFEHYAFVIQGIYRLTKPGRITAVHCMDIPRAGANTGSGLIDFSGDIIRAHEANDWQYCARYHVWKEPLGVRNRTMAKGLAHAQVVKDSTLCDVAAADYLLMFRKPGDGAPVEHPNGLTHYAGERKIPADLQRYRGWNGNQIQNRYSHWIWRQYASAFWDDVRLDRVLPHRDSREPDDERHVHPLQLDVIERGVVLWSNPGDVVMTPFMGVGSEVYGSLINGRRALGIELKESYFKQAAANCRDARREDNETIDLFDSAAE